MASVELPEYQCHKQVYAVKIGAIDYNRCILTPEDPQYEDIHVAHAYIVKHSPKVGGYFVMYEDDGYQSYSPAVAFENGYTRIQ